MTLTTRPPWRHLQGTLLLNNIHKAPKAVLPLLKQTVDTASRGSMDEGDEQEEQYRCVYRLKGLQGLLLCAPGLPASPNLRSTQPQQGSLHSASSEPNPHHPPAFLCRACPPSPLPFFLCSKLGVFPRIIMTAETPLPLFSELCNVIKVRRVPAPLPCVCPLLCCPV